MRLLFPQLLRNRNKGFVALLKRDYLKSFKQNHVSEKKRAHRSCSEAQSGSVGTAADSTLALFGKFCFCHEVALLFIWELNLMCCPFWVCLIVLWILLIQFLQSVLEFLLRNWARLRFELRMKFLFYFLNPQTFQLFRGSDFWTPLNMHTSPV